MLLRSRDESAINEEGGAGNPFRIVGGEEHGGSPDIPRFAEARQGGLFGYGINHLLREVVLERRLYVAWTDGVHGYAETPDLYGGISYHVDDAGFRWGISRSGAAAECVDGGDLDDASILGLLQVGDGEFRRNEDGAQVRSHDPVPLCNRNILRPAGDVDCRRY